MSRIAYVNGRYLPQREASVNIEDRGYQFADGIYEVVHLHNGRFIDEDRHLDRLDRSLREIRLPEPMSRAALRHVLAEVARRNRVREGLLYMQITRGVARRDHAFPSKPIPPSVVVTIRRIPPYPTDVTKWTASAISAPRVQPGRMAWSSLRVRSTPSLSTIQTLVAAPSVTIPSASSRIASIAPCSLAAWRASTFGRSATLLMSQRAQR